MVRSRKAQVRFRERLFQAGVFLLPLICWPGLAHPFSTPKLVLLAALDLALAVDWLLRKPGHAASHMTDHERRWSVPPWLLWPAALALSASLAPYPSLAALLLAALPLPLFLEPRCDPALALAWRDALRWASTAESAIVALQYIGLDPLRVLGWQPESFASPRMRIYGTLGNPDFVAAWLCATLPLTVCSHRHRRLPVWLPATLQLLAIFATGSRVFLVALPVAAAALALRRRRLEKFWLAGLPVAAAVLWLSPARPLDVTIAGRLSLDRATAAHLLETPLTGFGPGAFPLQFARWQPLTAGQVQHAHNDYLEFWIDYGPIGLAAFLALSAWLLSAAWRPDVDAAAWAGAAALLAIALVDFPFHRPAEWGLYWLLLEMCEINAARNQRSIGECHSQPNEF